MSDLHEELVKDRSFNEKFKNALRDYYSYGFKSYDHFDASARTVDADWARIQNILRDYFEWSFDKRTAFFASADSQALRENPLHRVYRFCRHNDRDPVFFFNAILALSPHAELRGDSEETGNVRVPGAPLSSSELAELCRGGGKQSHRDNNSINGRLAELQSLGLAKQLNEKKKGKKRWTLTDVSLSRLMECGRSADAAFHEHFENALDFFARNLPLGSLGTALQRRLGAGAPGIFRFKHEYFAQALNDFHLIDLLDAIENRLWCEIKYRHGTSDRATDLICFPLGFKISTVSGRTYLSFYDPFRRSLSNLRLEFIESVRCIRDGGITDTSGRVISLSDPMVESDIRTLLQTAKRAWGIAAIRAAEPDALHTVSLRISYDPKKEAFIANRVQRERRTGTAPLSDHFIDFSAELSDENEIRPWLRSFYSRLASVEGLPEGFVSEDVQNMVQALQSHGLAPFSPEPDRRPPMRQRDKRAAVKSTACTAHKALFHELFSVYYHVWAELLTRLYSDPNREFFTESELGEVIRNTLNSCGDELGVQTKRLMREELNQTLIHEGFLEEGIIRNGKWIAAQPADTETDLARAFRPRYSMTSERFFAEVLPLTALECRWLASMLDDPRIGLFLSEQEIETARGFLIHSDAGSAKPFPFNGIDHFDRHIVSEEDKVQEARMMPALLDAIRSNTMVDIRYLTAQQMEITGQFIPIAIEYSKRDDLFRGYFQSCKNGRIRLFNLARMQEIRRTDRTFDPKAAVDALEAHRESNMRSVQVEFYDVKNVADRILMEFSPWKKRCVYDRESQKYRLTIFYAKDDETELVVRLMGYGATIAFCDPENELYREIVRRVRRQLDILQESANAH